MREGLVPLVRFGVSLDPRRESLGCERIPGWALRVTRLGMLRRCVSNAEKSINQSQLFKQLYKSPADEIKFVTILSCAEQYLIKNDIK